MFILNVMLYKKQVIYLLYMGLHFTNNLLLSRWCFRNQAGRQACLFFLLFWKLSKLMSVRSFLDWWKQDSAVSCLSYVWSGSNGMSLARSVGCPHCWEWSGGSANLLLPFIRSEIQLHIVVHSRSPWGWRELYWRLGHNQYSQICALHVQVWQRRSSSSVCSLVKRLYRLPKGSN